MGGMEDLKAEVAEEAVKPYWWPIQPEEWKLDYWTKQGFNIFVVLKESDIESSGRSPSIGCFTSRSRTGANWSPCCQAGGLYSPKGRSGSTGSVILASPAPATISGSH